MASASSVLSTILVVVEAPTARLKSDPMVWPGGAATYNVLNGSDEICPRSLKPQALSMNNITSIARMKIPDNVNFALSSIAVVAVLFMVFMG